MSRPKVFVTRPSVPKEGIDLLRKTCDVEVYDEEKTNSKRSVTERALLEKMLCFKYCSEAILLMCPLILYAEFTVFYPCWTLWEGNCLILQLRIK
ncbi:hypothetical protein CEXT_791161, partial [Caerostris extrusa]